MQTCSYLLGIADIIKRMCVEKCSTIPFTYADKSDSTNQTCVSKCPIGYYSLDPTQNC